MAGSSEGCSHRCSLCSLSGQSGSLLQVLASWPRLWDMGLGQTFWLWVEIRK